MGIWPVVVVVGTVVETAFSYLNVGNGIGACISSSLWTRPSAAVGVASSAKDRAGESH